MSKNQISRLSVEQATDLLPELTEIAQKPSQDQSNATPKSIQNFNILRVLYQAQHGLHLHPFLKEVNTNLLSTPLYILPKFKWVTGDQLSCHHVFEAIYTKTPSSSKKGNITVNKQWQSIFTHFSSFSLASRLQASQSPASPTPPPNLPDIQTALDTDQLLPPWPNVSHTLNPISNSSKKRDRIPHIIQPCVDYYIVIDFECTCLPRQEQVSPDTPNVEATTGNHPAPMSNQSPHNPHATSHKDPKHHKDSKGGKTKKKGQRGYQPQKGNSKSTTASSSNKHSSNSNVASLQTPELLDNASTATTTTIESEFGTPSPSDIDGDGDVDVDVDADVERRDYSISPNDNPSSTDNNQPAATCQPPPTTDSLDLDPNDPIDPRDGSFQHEIIEFPAILINARDLTVVSIFHSYVKPTLNPTLSKFCTKLTGITQDQVDVAPTIDIVLILLANWLKEYGIVFHNSTFIFQSLINATVTPAQTSTSTPLPTSIPATDHFATLHSILNSSARPSIPNLARDSSLESIMSGDPKASVNIDRRDIYVHFNKLAEFTYLTEFPTLLAHIEPLHTPPPTASDPGSQIHDDSDDDDGVNQHVKKMAKAKAAIKALQQIPILDPSVSTPTSPTSPTAPTTTSTNASSPTNIPTDSDSPLQHFYQFLNQHCASAPSLPIQIQTALEILPTYSTSKTSTTTPPNTFLPPQQSTFDKFEYFLQTLKSMQDSIQAATLAISSPTPSLASPSPPPSPTTPIELQLSNILAHFSKSTTILHSQAIAHHQLPSPSSSTSNPSSTHSPSPLQPTIRNHTALLVSDGPSDFLDFLTPELRRKGLHWLLIYLFGITNTNSTATATETGAATDPPPSLNPELPDSTPSTSLPEEPSPSQASPVPEPSAPDPDAPAPKARSFLQLSPAEKLAALERKRARAQRFKLSCLRPPDYFDAIERVDQVHVQSNLYYCNIRHCLYHTSYNSKSISDAKADYAHAFSLSFPNNLSPTPSPNQSGQERKHGFGTARHSVSKPFLSTIFPSDYIPSTFELLVKRICDNALLPHVSLFTNIPQSFLTIPAQSKSKSKPSATKSPPPPQQQTPVSMPAPSTISGCSTTTPSPFHQLKLISVPPITSETPLIIPKITYKFEQLAMTPWRFFIGKYQGGGVPHFLQLLCMNFIGKLHSGINDSINITRILYHVLFHSDLVLSFTGIGAI